MIQVKSDSDKSKSDDPPLALRNCDAGGLSLKFENCDAIPGGEVESGTKICQWLGKRKRFGTVCEDLFADSEKLSDKLMVRWDDDKAGKEVSVPRSQLTLQSITLTVTTKAKVKVSLRKEKAEIINREAGRQLWDGDQVTKVNSMAIPSQSQDILDKIFFSSDSSALRGLVISRPQKKDKMESVDVSKLVRG